MGQEYYWTYWIHKLQELWHELESLKKRVTYIESKLNISRIEENTHSEKTREEKDERKSKKNELPALKEFELTVCMALKELGTAATVQEINHHLEKTRNIKEDIKTTLLRLKGAIQKGYIAINPETKRFNLIKNQFMVA